MMIVRSQLWPDRVEIMRAERVGYSTVFTAESASTDEDRYAEIINEIQAVEGGAGYQEMLDVVRLPEVGSAPFTFNKSAWPLGSLVKVANEVGDEMEYAGQDDMQLTDPGEYIVYVAPDLPYHTAIMKIVIS